MDTQLIEAIHRRIDEHHQYLCDRLDQVQETMQAMHATIVERLDAHEAYHRRNEHRFGLMRLAERHPVRLALLAFVGGGLLLATAPESAAWLARTAGQLVRQWLR